MQESKLYKAFQEAFAISKNLNEKQKKKLYALRQESVGMKYKEDKEVD